MKSLNTLSTSTLASNYQPRSDSAVAAVRDINNLLSRKSKTHYFREKVSWRSFERRPREERAGILYAHAQQYNKADWIDWHTKQPNTKQLPILRIFTEIFGFKNLELTGTDFKFINYRKNTTKQKKDWNVIIRCKGRGRTKGVSSQAFDDPWAGNHNYLQKLWPFELNLLITGRGKSVSGRNWWFLVL